MVEGENMHALETMDLQEIAQTKLRKFEPA